MALFKHVQSKRIQAACGCHMGKKRKNNEDNFYFDGTCLNSDNTGMSEILTQETLLEEGKSGSCHYYAVFDGMGGGDYGEVASNIAAETAREFLSKEQNVNYCDITPTLQNMCQIMSRNIYEAGVNLGAVQMGSTVVSLFFYSGQVWVFNLGDSRCYRLRDNEMEQISLDHTDEADMKVFGITGRKPYLTQYLGVNPEEMRIEPHVKSYVLKKGDRFLLCSDGLTDMVSEQEICDILSEYEDLEICTGELMKAALDGGGRDNITVMVCQFD